MLISKNRLLAILAFSLITFLYLFGLSNVPVYLNQDEMMFGLNAHGVATSGADFYGNKMPFYFWHLGSFWATPIIVYVTSFFLKFLPFSEWSIRISSVFMGLISILGLALIGKKIFKNNFYLSMGIVIAGTVPALFINSRVLLDNIWPIPFVVAWLLSLKLFSDKKNPFLLFVSGLFLGMGLHSYHAAKIVMPIYFAATIVYLFLIKKIKILNFSALIFGFLIPIIMFIPWLKAHPDTLLNQVSYISGIDKSVRASNGVWGVFNLKRLKNFSTNYFSYLSPGILFTQGDRSLIHSTGKIGAFSFGLSFLLVFGIMEVVRRKGDWFSKLVLTGFLTYPIAPAIVNDPQRISRGLIVIPFAVLLSLYGIYFLQNQKERIFKYLFIGILFSVIFEFLIFTNDYFNDYRIRSVSFLNGDIGSLYESVIRSTTLRPVQRIYINKNISFAEYYFNFYQIKFGKNLNSETIYFDPLSQDFSRFPQGSLVAVKTSDIPSKPDHVGAFEKIETIHEVNGDESYLVYWRDK